GRRLSPQLRQRVGTAVEFLYQCQDEDTGQVSLYGANDGALILPLSNCDYLDYRPVVQSASFQTNGQAKFDDGQWNEESLWLFGLAPSAKNMSDRSGLTADVGGYYILR